MKSTVRILLILVLPFAFAKSAGAQSNVGLIRGRVTDQNGAVVQGATVRLTSSITGYSQTRMTDADGTYQLLDVPFNDYVLWVQVDRFEPFRQELTIKSNVVHQVDPQLRAAGASQEITISAGLDVINPEKTAPTTVVDRNWILRFPSAAPSRSAEQIIATAPGWTEDANGRLHARGIEYQVQYSIDGIPVTDTIADTFAASPDPRTFRSVEISTANIPAEYGNKVAGVIAVTSKSGLELANEGSVTMSGGSFETVEGSVEMGGHTKKFGYFISSAFGASHRFLDPPAIENFHNEGSGLKFFTKLDYTPNPSDLFRLNLFANAQGFDVPNLPDQEAEGQNQRRNTNDNMQSFSWQHIFSPNLVGYLAGYHRYNSADLKSNDETGPVWAEQSRHHSNYGLLGSLSYHKSRHTIKGGFEFTWFPVTESFTFAITDLDELLEKEPDLPEEVQGFTIENPFFFRDHQRGWEGSAYIQDHINAARNLTFDVGLRYDSYHFLVDKDFVSPRVGVAYHFDKSKTVLRASYDRFLETPALENLLLSSSPEAQIFSPAGEDDMAARKRLPVRLARTLRAAQEPDQGDADKGAPVE